MRQPSAIGSAIDQRRLRKWTARFGGYRDPVTNLTIEGWLAQFKSTDRDLGARVLDVVDFYSVTQIRNAFRSSLEAIDGWNVDDNSRRGKWRFAAMSGSAGESGDMMLYHFRLANGLTHAKYHSLFVARSELFRLPLLPPNDPNVLGPDDTVVLVDDFSGTGKQICDAWNNPETSFGALLAGVGRVFLILIAGSQAAHRKILTETGLTPSFVHHLNESDNLFSPKCTRFSEVEKKILLKYCKRASSRNPKGYGNSGLVVVFEHRCPNNSIPILHSDNDKWSSLFPRHDEADS